MQKIITQITSDNLKEGVMFLITMKDGRTAAIKNGEAVLPSGERIIKPDLNIKSCQKDCKMRLSYSGNKDVPNTIICGKVKQIEKFGQAVKAV